MRNYIQICCDVLRRAFLRAPDIADLYLSVFVCVLGLVAWLAGYEVVLNAPAWLQGLIFFCVVILIRLILAPFWIIKQHRDELDLLSNNINSNDQVSSRNLNAVRRGKLVNAFGLLSNDHSGVGITVYPSVYLRFGRDLGDAFSAAGWDASFNDVAQELFGAPFREGVEVSGHNRHLVGAVCEALKEVGIGDAYPAYHDRQPARDHVKWNRSQNSIGITIGHIGEGSR